MYTRFLTYDLNYATSDEYQDLYDLIEEYDYKKITESTYKISTNEGWETFKNKFYNRLLAYHSNFTLFMRKVSCKPRISMSRHPRRMDTACAAAVPAASPVMKHVPTSRAS